VIEANDAISKDEGEQILNASGILAKSLLCPQLHPDSENIDKHCVDNSYCITLDSNFLKAYWNDQEGDAHEVPQIFDKGHKVATWTFSFLLFLDTSGAIEVARVWFSLVDPWFN
jgi:hypothetical protein